MASRSGNGVLVRYKNQTRKIQGDWSRRSYKNLVREIRGKFDIEGTFDVQVLDKQNNAYFTIDKFEMNEITRGAQIRIVKAKGSPKGKAPKGGKKKGGQMKPPGVPAYSKADNKARNQWRKGSVVEMYSEKAKKWMKGEVLDIFNDREGEWLVVKAGYRTGEIQRFSNFIRVAQGGKKKQTKKQQQQPKNKKKPEPKAKKVSLPTTQSKYKKAPKPPLADSLQANEIHIKGNTQNVKKFIDRAVALLQGTYVEQKKDAVKNNEDDDEKAEVEVEAPKQYDTIHLFGSNRSMGAVVSVSEVVKKCIPNLHQVTTLESVTITDSYIPLEIGLKEVEVQRPLAQLKITLSLNAKDVDVNASGYQAPSTGDDFAPIDRIPTRGTRGGGRGGRRDRGRGRGKK